MSCNGNVNVHVQVNVNVNVNEMYICVFTPPPRTMGTQRRGVNSAQFGLVFSRVPRGVVTVVREFLYVKF